MPRLIVIDTLYEDFLRTFTVNPQSTYESELQRLLDQKFGTFDAFSVNLRKLDWEAIDVISNCHELQMMWMRENGFPQGPFLQDIVDYQISRYKPDVVFLQDLSIEVNCPRAIVAGQCSCRYPKVKNLQQCQVIFSSIPDHVADFKRLGIQSVFLPLAFEPSVLQEQGPRDLDVVFVGGLGRNSYWERGTELFEQIASKIGERFHWYGYATGPMSPRLQSCYRGAAWGGDMYRLYQRARIVVNRHGEISRGAMNNLRCFEATGCGALLLTEDAPNLGEFFESNECAAYSSANDCIEKIKHFLANESERSEIARNGQARTLRDHNYRSRMAILSNTLQEMLVHA